MKDQFGFDQNNCFYRDKKTPEFNTPAGKRKYYDQVHETTW